MVSTAAAQLGVLAACIVLFVPMALAGLHLSRNKMLFFSGALFISLAVLVHLSPYLPSLLPSPSSFSSSPSLQLDPTTPLSCLRSLSRYLLYLPSSSSFAFKKSPPHSSCRFQKLTRSDSLQLMNGSTITFAGDSQTRLLALAFLRLLLPPPSLPSTSSSLFRRHSDYHLTLPSFFTLHFLWCPFESNLSSSLLSLSLHPPPDVLVAGSGLWHMLHVSNATDYGLGLRKIKAAASQLHQSGSHLFWIGLPTLIRSMLNTEEKRSRMNATTLQSYEREVEQSGILRQDGGPFFLLDVGFLSVECGSGCTEDGMHYGDAVYDAAVQVMLNALLIESRQLV